MIFVPQDQSEINLSEGVKQTICGLEISFSSAPQDIDIKLIPTCHDCLPEEEQEEQEGQ